MRGGGGMCEIGNAVINVLDRVGMSQSRVYYRMD